MVFWVLRISESNKAATRDFIKFQEEINTTNQSLWDKDFRNKMKTGDWVGFIHGPANDAQVWLFQVIEERPIQDRKAEWNNHGYSDNCEMSTQHREVVVLSKDRSMVYSWNQWRNEVGYKPNYWPQGTSIVRAIPKMLQMHE